MEATSCAKRGQMAVPLYLGTATLESCLKRQPVHPIYMIYQNYVDMSFLSVLICLQPWQY